MRVTIYRGTHEIGGTFLELKTDNTRILLDAGYPLFLDGLPIEKEVAEYPVEKLLDLKVIPRVDGLYSWDDPGFDAVVISHAHIDHYGLVKYIHPSIPIYMSPGSKKLIEVSQMFGIVDQYNINFVEFEMYKPFEIGDISIKPYLMDHSAFDAAAFEIKAQGKTVIYSGDFRGHGRKSVCLDTFINNVAKSADVLFIEGTMFGRQDEEILTEDGLLKKVMDVSKGVAGPVLFQSSSQNIDRLVSFYKASRKLGKLFIIDVYTANVLNELRKLGKKLPYPSGRYGNIRVYFPYHLTTKMFDRGYGGYMSQFRDYKITWEEMKEEQKNILMAVRPSIRGALPKCGFRDGMFIYSLWQGYRDSKYQQTFEEKLKEYGFSMMHIHTSGHASVKDISKTIRGLRPKKIIPVHSMYPEQFENMEKCVEIMDDGVSFEI